MARREKKVTLEGIVYKEGNWYVARCLTIDHAAQAKTPAQAIMDCIAGVQDDLEFAIQHGTLDHIRPAPFREMLLNWLGNKPYKARELTLSLPAGPGNRRSRSMSVVARFERTHAPLPV